MTVVLRQAVNRSMCGANRLLRTANKDGVCKVNDRAQRTRHWFCPLEGGVRTAR